MTRTKLPDRRASETRKIKFAYPETGNEQTILVTIGFDESGGAKEVFCADFKAGTTLQAVVMDACIVVSRLLQFGDNAAELFASMSQGPSLIGAIVASVAGSAGPRIERGDHGSVIVTPPKPLAPAGAAAELVS